MKIRRSLKRYFIWAMMLMGIVTVLSFATLAANYFVEGLDNAQRHTMIRVGQETRLQPGEKRTVIGFNLVTRWEDVPLEVREAISRPEQHLAFRKYLQFDYWFMPPSKAMFLLRYDQPGDQTLYIYQVIHKMKPPYEIQGLPHFVQIFMYAVLGIAAFACVLFVILNGVAKPIEKLLDWTRHLTPEKLEQPNPDFYYNELNYLAEIVSNSLNSVQQTLVREKQFLSYASHELRTPIAVVRSNSELLAKLMKIEGTQHKQQEVLERITRAGITMTNLCETLLWLNRGQESELPLVEVDLAGLVEQITNELHYLIQSKGVRVESQLSGGKYPLPETLCRIVLANLIRNAFQHTHRGLVKIEQEGQIITITNFEEQLSAHEEHLGFGLGLELTRRIIAQYHWDYEVMECEYGRRVKIDLSWHQP